MSLDIHIKPFSLENKNDGASFSFRVYKGSIQASIFTKGGGRPAFSANLNPFQLVMLKSVLKKIKEASPATKIPLKKEKFDPNTKQWGLEWVVTLQKDDKMVYHILVTNCVTNASFDFVMKGQGGISMGADPMSEASKSAVHMEVLLDWLEKYNYWAVATDEKFDPNNRGGGNKGGGGYNNSNQNNAPASMNDTGDDFPF